MKCECCHQKIIEKNKRYHGIRLCHRCGLDWECGNLSDEQKTSIIEINKRGIPEPLIARLLGVPPIIIKMVKREVS